MPSCLSWTSGAAPLKKPLCISANMTIPGATNCTKVRPPPASPWPPRASTKTARNRRLETIGPPIDSTPYFQ
jgi:hypothetical protein